MKYKFFILIAIISMLINGCSQEDYDREMEGGVFDGVSTLTYDGCQYVSFNGRKISGHKGNCKNPIHIQNCGTLDTLALFEEYMENQRKWVNSIN